MPYITREDGERFVIPSYRDVMSTKNKNALKRDILLLSSNYGEYITMRRKNPMEFEVAFSPDIGYLLGESFWAYFKEPKDMIYCEVIPNTSEAILVIVKSGSVYLDGTFAIDSIPEELVVFLTQQNNFEIFIYGDVPISQTPQAGKFSFEASSVKAFTVLDKPVFAKLPLLKVYQFRLVDEVLKTYGIGVFPLKPVLVGVGFLVVVWVTYNYLTRESPQIASQITFRENPYQSFFTTLSSPDPSKEVNLFLTRFLQLLTMPGWSVKEINYNKGVVKAVVMSRGAQVEDLMGWANKNRATISIETSGIYVVMNIPMLNRLQPRNIYSLNAAMARFIDHLANVYPGNRLQVSSIVNKGAYKTINFSIDLNNLSPAMVALIGQQFQNLPFVLQKMDLAITNGSISGSIFMEALGN